ncbi:hypothetical protein [Ruegeria atlantica]|uniref:Uncharacterized protein n=1 Tax=Ruegeria atlantica TaxID=81569 RepID=A0A0P1E181_9RHOB|nr:hypothetical protein [Ruegeria atlantica]CUH41486.1 hypothetical protein RUM4293_00358 [Ruegeria atlantica]
MISIVTKVIALFLLVAALYLAYYAGSFQQELKDTDKPPPVVLFSIVVALAAYLLLVLV